MKKRCFSCMNPIDRAICPHCGFDNDNPDLEQEHLLLPGSVVGGRYTIGIPFDQNGEGITYIAFDEEKQIRVRVREFFPTSLCYRDSDHRSVCITVGYEIQFKALLTDYVELSRQLIGIRAHTSLLQAESILSDNGTVYTIYEDVVGVSLNDYLAKKGGKLSWEETENLFLPLLYTVKLLNSNGIVHRGISPQNILVTSGGELKLKGICTSAVRAVNTELQPELFDGYAAPEQYEKCASHGEWTDVYAVCAILYRVLTGVSLDRADIRGVGASVPSPHQLEESVPISVSNAIQNGLEWERTRRTSYIKDLIRDLYAPVSSSSFEPPRHITNEEDDEEPEENIRSGKPKKKRKLPLWLTVVLITLPLMLILFFLTYLFAFGGNLQPSSAISSQASSGISSQPSEEASSSSVPSSEISSAVVQIQVDNFVGKYYDDVVKSEVYAKMYRFGDKKEAYSDNYPSGEIIAQSVAKDTVVSQGQQIQLTVSKGPQYVQVPALTDANGTPVTPSSYQKYFTDRGINAKIITISDPTYPSGQIVRLDHAVGDTLDREKVQSITIYVAG